MKGMKITVASRTLRPEDQPDVPIVGEGFAETTTALKAEPGKDSWLFGVGVLSRNLPDTGLVGTVEIVVTPSCCRANGVHRCSS